MKANILLTAILLSFFSVAIAQQAPTKIKFDKITHDFGKLKKGAPAEHTFIFTNEDGAPVSLQHVKASCGCTTPNWTKEPVEPGAQGEIKVKYNSNRVGRFTKSITVRYDSVERPIVLYIRGEVETPAPSADAIYTIPQGGLSFDKVVNNFGTMDSDKESVVEFKVRNSSPHQISFTDIEAPEYFNVETGAVSLTPGQNTIVKVVVKGASFERSQHVSDKVVLVTDDAQGAKKELTITGRVQKVYSQAELDAMPNIEFEATEYKGESVIEGEKLSFTYKFKNTGGSDLEILSVKASCGCTATSPKDKVVPAGGESEIVATFNSRGRVGKQHKTITVRTNDPDQSNIILHLEAEVIRDPFSADDMGPTANPFGGQ